MIIVNFTSDRQQTASGSMEQYVFNAILFVNIAYPVNEI